MIQSRYEAILPAHADFVSRYNVGNTNSLMVLNIGHYVELLKQSTTVRRRKRDALLEGRNKCLACHSMAVTAPEPLARLE